MLLHSCAYSYLFETPPPPGSEKMRLYEAAPHPFILELNRYNVSNEKTPTEILGFNLFGTSYRYLPYVIHALNKAGQEGLGKYHQRYTLAEVWQYQENAQPILVYDGNGKLLHAVKPEIIAIPPCPKTVTVHLDTPLRIKQEGKNCNAERFSFAAFFGNLQRRISLLTYFHTDTPLETDFKYLAAQAKTVELHEPRLSWQDWTRYSSRQQTQMQMGGLVGQFTITDNLELFWPYLWLGQWTHAGKSASMGLGAYRLSIVTPE